MLITVERKVTETCGFQHLKEDIGARSCGVEFDWSAIHQSGEFSLDILKTIY